MQPAIRIENLGKCYRVAKNRDRSPYRTFRETLTDAALAPIRRAINRGMEGHLEEFWALKDVSFEVQPGEVVGIIGRNGAGKSTLLKILSRITKPTKGRIVINGRVGSLLEVGTGFHPELTGRENIYLNGSILGMSRAEIKAKFDEIVAFAEIDQFLDTPVKRYSSGMYVRLAFAVAAHLEPEILIVDEVLAVGDAEFQKKCMGKMKDVAGQGRTVLFVSHNMAAVRNLCLRGVYLARGQIEHIGTAEDALEKYFSSSASLKGEVAWQLEVAPQSQGVALTKVWVADSNGASTGSLDFRDAFQVNVEYTVIRPTRGIRIGIEVRYSDGTIVFGSSDYGVRESVRNPGKYIARCRVPQNTLNSGIFSVTAGADLPNGEMLFLEENCIKFQVVDGEGHGAGYGRPPGVARPALTWEVFA